MLGITQATSYFIILAPGSVKCEMYKNALENVRIKLNSSKGGRQNKPITILKETLPWRLNIWITDNVEIIEQQLKEDRLSGKSMSCFKQV